MRAEIDGLKNCPVCGREIDEYRDKITVFVGKNYIQVIVGCGDRKESKAINAMILRGAED